MKRWLWPFVGIGWLGSFVLVPKQTNWTVFVGGNEQGYLSPCGCTQPMNGGIRRRNAVIKQTPGETLFLSNGPAVTGIGRQNEIKSETIAESWSLLQNSVHNLTEKEADLGRGAVLAMVQLARHPVISSSVDATDLGVQPYVEKGPFSIFGMSSQPMRLANRVGSRVISDDDVLSSISTSTKQPIVLLEGSLDRARQIARSQPEIRLIVYSNSSHASKEPEKVGDTWIVTPGERGKQLVRLNWNGQSFTSSQTVDLDPTIADDPATQTLFRSYLRRIGSEKLLDRLPRIGGPPFAGRDACKSCHSDEHRIWKASSHSHALKTLEQVGQDRDPDCVRCHVTGLNMDKGFRNRKQSPALADVTCESCHKSAKAHSVNPAKVKMKKVGELACLSCHTPDNSPNFAFKEYWSRIRH